MKLYKLALVCRIHHIFWSWQTALVIGQFAIFRDKIRGGVVIVRGKFHNETRNPTSRSKLETAPTSRSGVGGSSASD